MAKAAAKASRDPRVRRAEDKEDLLKFLTDSNEGAFKTLASALTFAAALGYANDKRTPFEKSGPEIRWTVFQEEGKTVLADLLAAVTSDDLEIVRSDRIDERLEIFAEYANGGLEILRRRVLDNPRPAEDVLLEMVLDAEEADGAEETGGLEELAGEVAAGVEKGT